MLYLKELNLADAEKEYAFFQGFPSENGFENPYYGMDRDVFVEKAIPEAMGWARGEHLKPGYVPETCFLFWEDDDIVGVYRVRHFLNAALAEGAGHIGYAIHPKYRGWGYARQGLALAIEELKKMPDFVDDAVCLRCLRYNVPSWRAMLRNGGVTVRQDEEHYFVRIPI